MCQLHDAVDVFAAGRPERPEAGIAVDGGGDVETHLVNLAVTDADSSGGSPSLADRESERSRSDGTGRGREGRASRAGEGGNAAGGGKRSRSAQLALNWNGKRVNRSAEGIRRLKLTS